MMSIRARMRRDDGISLAELLVSASISVLILTIIGAFFTSVVKGVNTSEAADTSTRQATTAINTMVQYLHAATTYPVAGQTIPNPAFVTAGATDVKFYAYVNLVSTAAQPVEVRFYVDQTSHFLIEQLWSSTCSATTQYCTFSTTVTSQYKLGGPIPIPKAGDPPLFSYYDSSGTNPTTTLSAIDYVGINLELGSTTAGAAGNTHVMTSVGLLNLGQSGAGTS
jgi:hypothetical protein